MPDPKANSETYWATEPSEKCAEEVLKRRSEYLEWFDKSGLAGRALRMWRTFYGLGPDGDADSSRVTQVGDQGELADTVVNQFAALVRQGMVLIASSKPAFKAIAENTDYDSLAQAPLADGLIEHYDRSADVGEYEWEATFSALLMLTGWVGVTWNPNKGRPYGMNPDTGRVENEGELEFAAYTPFDVFFDTDVRDPRERLWFGTVRPRNKWDLMALYPDMADEIRLAPESDKKKLNLRLTGGTEHALDQVDTIEWFHIPSPAVPLGRMLVCLSPKCVLFDSMEHGTDEETGEETVTDFGIPYDEVPVYEIQPDRILGSASGHSGMVDLVGLQECVDMTATIATSTLNATGLKNMWLPKGEVPSVSQLPGNLNVLQSANKPEYLEGPSVDPAVEKFLDIYVSMMRQIAGVNDVVMGEPDKGMPAQLAALMRAQAIEYHSHLQKSFGSLREKVRTAIIKLLKRYAHTERVALLAGKTGGYQLKAFTAQDLSQIAGVTIEEVNPAMRTYAGKIAFGDKLLDGGHCTPEQYLTFVNTGRLEPMFENQQANLMRIRRDCELLRQGVGMPPVKVDPLSGQPVIGPNGAPLRDDDGQTPYIRPFLFDTHWLDIPEYLAVTAAPDARSKGDVTTKVTELVSEKMRLWQQMPPVAQLMLGCPPQLVQGMPMMGGAPGAGPGAPPPADPLSAHAPAPGGGAGPKLPKPPKNPLNGEQAPQPEQMQ